MNLWELYPCQRESWHIDGAAGCGDPAALQEGRRVEAANTEQNRHEKEAF